MIYLYIYINIICLKSVFIIRLLPQKRVAKKEAISLIKIIMAKVRIIINRSKKDRMGLCPLKVRVTQEGQRKEVYLPNIKIEPKYWNASKQKVTNDTMLNTSIQKTILSLSQEIHKCLAQEVDIIPSEIINKVKTRSIRVKVSSLNAIEYCKAHFLNDPNLVYSTRKTYGSFIRLLNEYDPKVTLDKIDLNWTANFREYLVSQKKLNQYSISTRLKHVRRICKHAHQKKVIPKYLLEGFKIKQASANRKHLSIEQIRTLEAYKPDPPLEMTCNAFLFSCYTGMRFSDLASLTFKNIIVKEHNGSKEFRLQYCMKKTNKQLDLILCQKALNLLTLDKLGTDELIFNLINKEDLNLSSDKLAMKIESANALANKRFKEVYKNAGLKEHLSFHCARHTFFCIALELGVDLVSLRELGGHSDLKVTQEYLKVTDTRKNEAMMKFDKI